MIETSTTIGTIAAALCKVQAKLKTAPKTKTNPHFKSTYADLDQCWETARGELTTAGLCVFQGASAIGKVVTVTTMLMHGSGEWMRTSLTMEARDAGPQAIGAAVTYGRRYGFCAAIGLTSDEDDDGNSASQPRQSRAAATSSPAADKARVGKMRSAFHDIEVPDDTILAHVGRKSFDEITVADMTKLAQLYDTARQPAGG